MPPPGNRDEDKPVLKEPENEMEKHLTEECGLTILELYELEEQTEQVTSLPEDEHPSWNAGTAELWECPEQQWYDQPDYDRVLLSPLQDKTKSELYLRRRCMKLGTRRVGEMFYSTGHWCIRVKDVEV